MKPPRDLYEHQATLQKPGLPVEMLGDGWEYAGGCIVDDDNGAPVFELVRWRRRREKRLVSSATDADSGGSSIFSALLAAAKS